MAWQETYGTLSQLESPTGEELELLATSAYMLGLEDEWMEILGRAFRRHSDDGESLRQVTGRPVLGTLSVLTTEPGLARRRAANLRFGLVLCLMMAAQVTWVAMTALHPHTL